MSIYMNEVFVSTLSVILNVSFKRFDLLTHEGSICLPLLS